MKLSISKAIAYGTIGIGGICFISNAKEEILFDDSLAKIVITSGFGMYLSSQNLF